jgi:hypothetical protein
MIMSLPQLQDRKELPSLFSGVGVEIGVWVGSYSVQILESQPKVTKLISVDPWQSHPTLYDYTPWCLPDETPEACSERIYQSALAALSPFGERSVPMRRTSTYAANYYVPYDVDFVYIDSSHRYDETVITIEEWWRKLKSGGIFSGHDYINGEDVKRAVDEHVSRYGLKLFTTVQDSEFDFTGYLVNSWYLQKP